MAKEGAIFQEYLSNQRKSLKSIATDLGISRRTLYQYFDTNEFTPEIRGKIEGYFREKIFTPEAHRMLEAKNISVKPDSTHKEKTGSTSMIDTPSTAIYKLIDVQQNMAESHKRITETNDRLVRMLEQREGATANVAAQMSATLEATFHAFQELLLDVAVGTRFASKEEARAALVRTVTAVQVPTKTSKGTRKG